MMRWVPLAILLLVWFVPAHAATRYVNFCTGNDGNSGASAGAAWKTPNKVNTSAAANDTIYYAPSCTHTMTDNNTLVAKTGQTHTMEGGCAATTIANLPTIDGNNTWPTTGTGNRALFNIDGVNNVEVSCMRFINSNLNGIRIRNNAQNPRLISLVTGGHANQIITQSASTADPNPAMLNAVIENVYGFAATDMAQLCNESTGTTARYNTFIGPMADPVVGCNNSTNAGSTHEIAFNIVQDSGSGRRTISSGVDVTGGGQPLVSRNVWFHHNIIFNADNGCLEPFITTGVANNPGAEQIVDTHTYEYNLCAKLHLGATNRGCWDYSDNRSTTDAADWSNLILRNNLCVGSGTEVGLRMSPSALALTTNTNNAYHSGATFSGEPEGSNRQNVSTSDFRNYASNNYNLVAAATTLLNQASDATKHIGPMQPLTLTAGACTVETATPKRVCCNGNAQFAWDTAYATGTTVDGNFTVTVNGGDRTTTATSRPSVGRFCVDFDGADVTSGQTVVIDLAAGALGFGQVGSALVGVPTAMLRHENIAYTDFAVTNNVGASSSVVRTQTRYRWAEWSERPPAEWRKLLNTQLEIVPGGRALLGLQMQVTAASETQPQTYALHCSEDECNDADCQDGDGTYYAVGNTFGGNLIAFTPALAGTFTNLESITSTLLGDPGGGGAFVNGRYHADDTLFDPVALAQNNWTDSVASLQVSSAATPGAQIACRLELSDSTPLDVYSNTAVLIVRAGLAHGF